MVTTIRRTGEKGQRTPRSMDTYRETEGIRGGAVCRCGAVYRNKRWYSGLQGAASRAGSDILCPACRRTADHNPAGIVCLKGGFQAVHTDEIDRIVGSMVHDALKKNPLERVMETNRDEGVATITTTSGKLAQKIGRALFRSHGGELHFQWSQSEDMVRVTWLR